MLQIVGQVSVLAGVVLAVILVVGCATSQGVQPLPPPTALPAVCTGAGVCVHERFLAYYADHGMLIGEPIAAPSTFGGRLVQYFVAGRLEYVPEYPESYAVGLAYLGEELCGRQPPLHYSDVPAGHERQATYFPATGHSLAGDFRAFVMATGGVEVFGLPISEPRAVGGEMVQDFVRVQLRRDADREFYLAPLGRLALSGGALPEGLCPSVPADDPDT